MDDGAEFGSAEAGAKGGKARAEKLTKEQRSEIARRAAESRWVREGREPIASATHTGDLRLGNISIPCAVLEDGTRVLTQAEFLEAMGRHRKANVRREEGEEQAPPILQGKAIKPFISAEILEKSRPVRFRLPGGGIASGYRADLLPEVCEVFLRARDAGVLPPNQAHVAKQAEFLMRALAHVGIIALVDEATGYQDDRDRRALAKILEAFVAKELQPWISTFRVDFYKELFRLWKMPFDPTRLQKPRVVGTLTNNLVYSRLAPGVLEELRRKNPRNASGNRPAKHHQHLTRDLGHPRLQEHLAAVTALMKASTTKEQFMAMIDRALPKHVDAPLFNPQEDTPTLTARNMDAK